MQGIHLKHYFSSHLFVRTLSHHHTTSVRSRVSNSNLAPRHLTRQKAVQVSALGGMGSNTPLAGLMGTCGLMFLGAYVCGMLPAWLPVHEKHLISVSSLGAGLLLGSALGIILPEGFEAAMDAHQVEWTVPVALLAGFWLMLVLDTLSQSLSAAAASTLQSLHSGAFEAAAADHDDSMHADEHVINLSNQQLLQDKQSLSKAHASTPKASTRGIQKHSSSTAAGAASRSSGSMSTRSAAVAEASSSTDSSRDQQLPHKLNWAWWLQDPSQQALLGLVVHAVSDGLAVGASSLAAEQSVSVAVAAAMIIHKGPVAIGLAAYLQSAGWTAKSLQRGIALFASASPIAALLTYFLLTAMPAAGGGGNIPLAVLFSGGTVLYSATMHILPDLLDTGRQHHHHALTSANGLGKPQHRSKGAAPGSSTSGHQAQGASHSRLLLVTLGMVVPVLFAGLLHRDHVHH